MTSSLGSDTSGTPGNGSSAPSTLRISRSLKAPRHALWAAWSSPEHLVHWWCPKPWVTEVRAFDFRAGGAFHTFMRGPDGGESDNPGCFLEVVPQQRIVMTSQLGAGWQPLKPWLPMTAIIELADEPGGTRYTATCLHPDEAGARQHAEMGFHEGWGICIDQLDAYALTL
jgi:uncharacterized protein YndB with AHSA1/START domain